MESMVECMESIGECMESIVEYMEQKHSTWNPPGMWGQGKVLRHPASCGMRSGSVGMANAYRKAGDVVRSHVVVRYVTLGSKIIRSSSAFIGVVGYL